MSENTQSRFLRALADDVEDRMRGVSRAAAILLAKGEGCPPEWLQGASVIGEVDQGIRITVSIKVDFAVTTDTPTHVWDLFPETPDAEEFCLADIEERCAALPGTKTIELATGRIVDVDDPRPNTADRPDGKPSYDEGAGP